MRCSIATHSATLRLRSFWSCRSPRSPTQVRSPEKRAAFRPPKRALFPAPDASAFSASFAFLAAHTLFPASTLGEGDGIQHRSALIAQDREGAPDGAGRLVLTVAARRIKVHAGA